MIITKAEFYRSMKNAQDYFNTGLPEIAIAGKSNVGKSSLINMLANNGKLARVSKQPGKTRLINYFLLNNTFYLVDLPGYGFARVSKAEKESWAAMMQGYFQVASQLKLLAILVDIRHKPSADDIDMVRFAECCAIPYVICATKADKVAKSKRKNECARLKREIPTSFDYPVIPVSSQIKFGKDELLNYFASYLQPAEVSE